MSQENSVVPEDILFPQFTYVRDLLRTSENLSSFVDGLAVEGTVIDELLKSDIIDNDELRSAAPADLQSENRMQQAEFLLEKISACREVPIAKFLFFLSERKPGIINILEEGLLEQVQQVMETDRKDEKATPISSESKFEKGHSNLFTKSKETQHAITILCVGKSGTGKSTLANALAGKLATDAESARTGRGSYTVKSKTEKIECLTNEIPFSFWDTPGPTNTKDRKTFREIKKEVKKDEGAVNLLVFCAPAHEGRDTPENGIIIENVTKEFVVNPDNDKTTAAYFHKHCITEMTRRYRKFLTQTVGITPQQAETVPCVPIGRRAEDYLSDGTNWKERFWMTCVARASKDRGIL
ncbi:uncharacterized protein LOC134193266 [Corticium candelabrum]|uniref:uncharacterized protein LOC134193266 n=1 Tax=Corticium candelabrum TaxID=121492 RepID=UPI002E258C8A|nr:uncharacterized protein LOC134193266 [Corticium candelabrum]